MEFPKDDEIKKFKEMFIEMAIAEKKVEDLHEESGRYLYSVEKSFKIKINGKERDIGIYHSLCDGESKTHIDGKIHVKLCGFEMMDLSMDKMDTESLTKISNLVKRTEEYCKKNGMEFKWQK